MILAILKLEEHGKYIKGASSSTPASIGMVFKHFIWEYGFSFAPLEKAIAHDCEIVDRLDLHYILHSQNCNINQHLEEDGEVIDKEICTCALQTPVSKKVNKSDSQTKDPQAQLMTLLQRLMNNQQKEEEDFKTRSMQHGQSLHYSQAQLMIIDPLNKFNNIGKSSYNFAHIQQEFRDVHHRLNIEMSNYVRYAKSRIGGDQDRPSLAHVLPDILGIQYRMQEFDEPVITPIQEESKTSSDLHPTPAPRPKPVESTPQQTSAAPASKQSVGPKQPEPTQTPSATVITGKSGKNKKKQKGMGGKK